MGDIVDKKIRSQMMANIRSKDTKPEIVLRKALHAHGFRYRLHDRILPGRPDLVLRRYRAVVFVHGCFWHRHDECRYATSPATRPAFWLAKFEANKRRDQEVCELLISKGWRVATIWECALRRPKHVAIARDLLAAWLLTGSSTIDIRFPVVSLVSE